MSCGPYACHGYCIKLDQNVAAALEFNIQKLVSWLNPPVGYEDDLKEVEECTDFMDALDKAINNFGGVIYFEICLDGHNIDGNICNYDPDYGGIEDDLEEGYYIEFNEDKLFELKRKPAIEKLKEVGAEPGFCTWVVNS